MLESQIIQGRRIGGVEIAEVRGLIQNNPLWSRRRLSEALAEQWQWYAASGELKDMAARSLMLKLHERGVITLPERRRVPVARARDAAPDLFDSVPPESVVAKARSGPPIDAAASAVTARVHVESASQACDAEVRAASIAPDCA